MENGMTEDPYEPGFWPDGAPMLTTKPLSKREQAQAHCPGLAAARMSIDFQNEFRDVYGAGTMMGFTAVGPLASFIGYAIQTGWLAPGPRMLADPVVEEPKPLTLGQRIFAALAGRQT